MDSSRFRRRTVSLVAAYAVALQMLLSAFVPPAPVGLAGSFDVLCSHVSSDGAGHPLQHILPCAAVCAAMGHGIAGPLPPAFVAAIVVPHAVAVLTPASEWVPPQILLNGPHAPRGPPLA